MARNLIGLVATGAVVLTVVSLPDAALAGTGAPWEAGLTSIAQSFSGPVAVAAAIMAIVVAAISAMFVPRGLGIAFGIGLAIVVVFNSEFFIGLAGGGAALGAEAPAAWLAAPPADAAAAGAGG